MPRQLDARLARAKAYLAIAESKDAKREAYKRAANEIAAFKDATRATYSDIAISLGKSEVTVRKLVTWRRDGFKADTPFLMDAEATKRAARSHTKAVLSDPSEAAKVVADLPPAARKNLAKAMDDDPSGRKATDDVRDERYMRQAQGRAGRGRIEDPKLPHVLLRRIEGDRVKILHAVEQMVGHWHDHRLEADEEEQRLARDSMAETIIEVEKQITGALREAGMEEEVR